MVPVSFVATHGNTHELMLHIQRKGMVLYGTSPVGVVGCHPIKQEQQQAFDVSYELSVVNTNIKASVSFLFLIFCGFIMYCRAVYPYDRCKVVTRSTVCRHVGWDYRRVVSAIES